MRKLWNEKILLFNIFLFSIACFGATTGNELYEIKKYDINSFRNYVYGSLESMYFMKGDLNVFPCMSDRVTYNQMVDIVGKYLEDHPGERHQTAAKLIYVSITKEFPCPEQYAQAEQKKMGRCAVPLLRESST